MKLRRLTPKSNKQTLRPVVKQPENPEPPEEQPSVEEFKKLIKNLADDIESFEDEYGDDNNYPGILTQRTVKRMKKLMPELYDKLDLS